MKHNYTKEHLIERIEAVDAILVEIRMLWEPIEDAGGFIPADKITLWTNLDLMARQLVNERHEDQKVLKDTYGIIISNDWES